MEVFVLFQLEQVPFVLSLSVMAQGQQFFHFFD